MKKIKVIFLLALVVSALVLSSCRSSEQCAAYGEYKKYRVEKN